MIKMRRKLGDKKMKIDIRILIFDVAIIFFFIFAVSMSKYVFKLKDEHQIESSAFYFASDIAGIEKKFFSTENWNGDSELQINFDVENYENQSLITKKDIKYTISVEKIDDTNNEITAEIYKYNTKISGEQTLTGNALSTNDYVIKVSKNNSTITATAFNLKVKITSVSPYKKELVGNIKINIPQENNEISTLLKDNGDYVSLSIKTNDYLEDKIITYDTTKLVLDRANILLKDISIKSSENTNIFIITKSSFEKDSEYEINFVKVDSSASAELGTEIVVG